MRTKPLALLLVFTTLVVAANASPLTCTIPVTPGALVSYEAVIGRYGSDPLAVTAFNGPHAGRVTTSMILFQQAARLGGFQGEFKFYRVPNVLRAIHDVKLGAATAYMHDLWREHFDETVFRSSPVAVPGEIVKGIFHRAGDDRFTGLNAAKDLTQFRAITCRGWTVDRQTLLSMGINHIQYACTYETLLRMLRAGRADFTLLEVTNIPEPPPGLTAISGTLAGLQGSRHFMVSHLNPAGPELFEALEKGLAILRQQRRIQKAYRQGMGIGNSLSRWQILSSPAPH